MRDASDAFWGQALAPFFLLAILTIVGIPVTYAIRRWVPNSRIKSLLLDKTLFTRKPWVAWLGVILGYGFIGLVIYLVSVLR